jgi:hypothetical protein
MQALILGAATGVFDDLAVLRSIINPWPGPVIAVNRAGIGYTARIDHWVTLHPEFLADWLFQRNGPHHAETAVTWCQKYHDGARVDVLARSLPCTGSSGLFATRIALHILGCSRVVLAGMPIDDGPHFYDADGVRSGPTFSGYRPEWLRAQRNEFKGRVRSLSGWTAMRLGKPDAEWLSGAAG